MEEFQIVPACSEHFDSCAQLMCSTEPFITLKRDKKRCLDGIRDQTKTVFVCLLNEEVVGFSVLDLNGAFAGYLQTLVVDKTYQRKGLGTKLIKVKSVFVL